MKKRILCPTLPKPDRPAILTETEAHHATRVLRLREGDIVEALDGQGQKAWATLRVRGGPVRVEFLEPSQGTQSLNTPLFLELAVLKGSAMEWAVEKAVELGVHELIPVLTAHTVVQIKGKGPESFQSRWQKIADQSLKQCGRLSKMEIQLPLPFETLLTQTAKQSSCILRLWCDENAIGQTRSLLESIHGLDLNSYSEIRILVGPEGGWSSQERSILMKELEFHPQNLIRVNLGSVTLRAETAALYSTSLVASQLELKVQNT